MKQILPVSEAYLMQKDLMQKVPKLKKQQKKLHYNTQTVLPIIYTTVLTIIRGHSTQEKARFSRT